MSNPKTIMDLLKCDSASAAALNAVMYNYISPDWSEQSARSLRADLRMAAEMGGVVIVPAARAESAAAMAARVFGCTPAQAKALLAKNADDLDAMRAKASASGKKVNGYSADQLAAIAATARKNAK